jgi:hypothetical protein
MQDGQPVAVLTGPDGVRQVLVAADEPVATPWTMEDPSPGM